MPEIISLYVNEIITLFLFPFIYFLHHVTYKSMNDRMDDFHADLQHMYEQVSGTRERVVHLEGLLRKHQEEEENLFRDVYKEIEDLKAKGYF